MSSEMIDGLVNQALKELANQKESAISSTNYAFEEAKSRIEILREIGVRDVFKDALVIAVGDFDVQAIPTGDTVGVGHHGHSNYLVVTRSTLDEQNARKRTTAYWELVKNQPGSHQSPKLRAMLVIFEEKAPIGEKK